MFISWRFPGIGTLILLHLGLPLFANLLEQLAYLPSQQLLEYESAITILSRVNTRQSLRMEEQAQKLLEQESKLIQLLRIEAEALEHTPER